MSDGSEVRVAAARAVHAVASGGRLLEAALETAGAGLAARDRPLLAALVYGTVRWYVRLERVIAGMLERPLPRRDRIVHDLVAVGLFQLERMRVPGHAAVHATVAATAGLGRPRARGLVNALLRRFQRESGALLAAADVDVAVRHAYPPWLAQRLLEAWPEEGERLLAAGNGAPPMWLRVNRRCTDRDAYLARLQAAGLQAGVHAEAPDALCLAEPTDVHALPGFDDGEVSVQDASAQLAVEYLALRPGLRLLDACAAPGGKTAHALEREPALAGVVALDSAAARLDELRAGLQRLNLSAEVLCGDATAPQSWWDGRRFDRILLDAPCSATGVIRRHPDIKLHRRAPDVAALVQLQSRMLDALWPLLAPGGRLVYATCSLLPEENRERVRDFLTRHPGARLMPPGESPAAPGRQLQVGEANGDGFYYACLQHAALT